MGGGGDMSTPIVGLIMGSIFGACLVLAGLTDPDKIIGALRLKDSHAIRTLIVFVLVATVGTWILRMCGTANAKIIPAAIGAAAVGGALFGAGFGLAGFGPGTALASAASGRIDALCTLAGMLCGAHVYVLIYPSVAIPLGKIADYGSVTLPQVTRSSQLSWIVGVSAAGLLGLLLIRPWRLRRAKPRSKSGDLAIKEDFSADKSVLAAVECVEAARILTRRKNFAFVVIISSLLLLQGSFWLVKTGQINAREAKRVGDNKRIHTLSKPAATRSKIVNGKAAGASTNVFRRLKHYVSGMTFERLASAVRVANAALVFASLIYALTTFSMLAIPLGGSNHICRAFYLSLVTVLLLLPWQIAFGSKTWGVIYTPEELAKWCQAGTPGTALLYLRFTGWWILGSIVLILAQVRSYRWGRLVLRRL